MVLSRDVKKGSAELLVLSLLDERPRHGYELARTIEQQSGGAITFTSATLYPTLHTLERQGWLKAKWVDRAGERRRRYYDLTPAGRRALAAHRQGWKTFISALTTIGFPKRAR